MLSSIDRSSYIKVLYGLVHFSGMMLNTDACVTAFAVTAFAAAVRSNGLSYSSLFSSFLAPTRFIK